MGNAGGHHKRPGEHVGNARPVFITNLPFSNRSSGASIASTGEAINFRCRGFRTCIPKPLLIAARGSQAQTFWFFVILDARKRWYSWLHNGHSTALACARRIVSSELRRHRKRLANDKNTVEIF